MREWNMVERLAEIALRSGEPILKQPLLELYGEHRVLIEHHMGIGEYSPSKIVVNVGFGSIGICGTNLQISSMTIDQLIVIGEIDSIMILKGSVK